MPKILFYSKDPIINFNKTKSSCVLYLLLSLIASVIVYFSKGLVLSILTFLFLLFVAAFEFYAAKACLKERDEVILEKAYKNGLKINFVLKILLCLLLIYLFGLLYGSILSLIILIGSLLIIKKQS